MKKYTHKLTKTSSHSYFVIIPKEIVEKYGWRESPLFFCERTTADQRKQKMTIEDKGRGKVELRDWRS